MESIAVFDVLKAIDSAPAYMVDLNAPHAISPQPPSRPQPHLGLLFPNQTTSLDWELSQTLAVVPDGAREKAGVAFGEAVADAPMR